MSPLLRFLQRPVVALAIVAAVAGVLRFHHFGDPPSRVFDEVYYSKDACLYAAQITSQTREQWEPLAGLLASLVPD